LALQRRCFLNCLAGVWPSQKGALILSFCSL